MCVVIKNIAKLCKASRRVMLWYDGERDVQWISNGSACWPLYGMPVLDVDNVLTVLDIPEKDWEKIVVSELSAPPEGIDFGDIADEEEIRDPALSINFGGQLILPLQTAAGMLLADPELFRPMKDVDHMTLHVRQTDSGMRYLAAKGGLLLHGIIMPLNLKAFTALPGILSAVAAGLEESLERQTPDDEEAGQMQVDQETGEVLEA